MIVVVGGGSATISRRKTQRRGVFPALWWCIEPNLKFSPDAIVRRAHWPNKEGKGGIETAPNGTVPSTGRRCWRIGTEFAGGSTIRMEDPDPLADRICRSALSLFASPLLSIKGYILHSISEPAAW